MAHRREFSCGGLQCIDVDNVPPRQGARSGGRSLDLAHAPAAKLAPPDRPLTYHPRPAMERCCARERGNAPAQLPAEDRADDELLPIEQFERLVCELPLAVAQDRREEPDRTYSRFTIPAQTAFRAV